MGDLGFGNFVEELMGRDDTVMALVMEIEGGSGVRVCEGI
jgi:hypothetical protein